MTDTDHPAGHAGPQPEPSPSRDRRRDFRHTLVAAGAALGLTLAGLGVAVAQTGQTDGSSTTTTAPADDARPEGPRRFGPKPGLAAAARVIGISEADLVTALRSGKSVAQVAQEHNVEVQAVIDALVAEARERLAAAVEAGHLTQAQADQRGANLVERITEMVNRPGGLCHGPGGHGPRPGDA